VSDVYSQSKAVKYKQIVPRRVQSYGESLESMSPIDSV
jgi:hypothetical protein